MKIALIKLLSIGLLIIGFAGTSYGELYSWEPVDLPPHSGITSISEFHGNLYAALKPDREDSSHSLNIYRRGQTSKTWSACENGLDIGNSETIQLAHASNHLVAYIVSYQRKKSDFYELNNAATCTWRKLKNIAKDLDSSVDSTILHLYASGSNLYLGSEFEIFQITPKKSAHKLPHLQDLHVVAGKQNPLYGLSGDVSILEGNHWKPLGKGWPNKMAADIIEIGNTIYVSTGECDGFEACDGFLTLKGNRWTAAGVKICAKCISGSMVAHHNKVFTVIYSYPWWTNKSSTVDNLYEVDFKTGRLHLIMNGTYWYPEIKPIREDEHLYVRLSSWRHGQTKLYRYTEMKP